MTGGAKSPPASLNTTTGTSGFFLRMLERGLAYRKTKPRELVPEVRDRAGQRTGG